MQSGFREATDDVLVHAMRAGDEAAVSEFIERYQNLVLVQARRFRVPPDERQHWTGEVLYDVSLSLMRANRPAPGSLAGYLISACRRKAMMNDRRRRARMVRESAAVEQAGGERVVVAGCSEESLRQAHGVESEPPSLPAVLQQLVATLDDRMEPQERLLLSWMGHRVPYSTMAQWLGITRAAVIKRATRLRFRLLGFTFQFGLTLESADRRELARFLRRTGALDATALARLENQDTVDRIHSVLSAPAKGSATRRSIEHEQA